MDENGTVSTVRRRVLVDGRVQGVFFRDSCRDEAVRAGVAGWAANLADGRVEVVVEGEPEAVEGVVAWCRQGPPGARITDVQVTEQEPEGLSDFDVR
ncbi:MAG: acylphosphatase [Actinomycetota bacterium]|nr:acylphosphatase [Actinomycetota bacterium]